MDISISMDIYGYGNIHRYPRKICEYGYGYEREISYPQQPCIYPLRTVIYTLCQKTCQYIFNQCRSNMNRFQQKLVGISRKKYLTKMCKNCLLHLKYVLVKFKVTDWAVSAVLKWILNSYKHDWQLLSQRSSNVKHFEHKQEKVSEIHEVTRMNYIWTSLSSKWLEEKMSFKWLMLKVIIRHCVGRKNVKQNDEDEA